MGNLTENDWIFYAILTLISKHIFNDFQFLGRGGLCTQDMLSGDERGTVENSKP